jgi:hypothetical protein
MKAILSATLVLGLCGLVGAAGDKKAADPVGTWNCEYEIGGLKLYGGASTFSNARRGGKEAVKARE